MPVVALLFPGQGSQYPGIGKDLHDQYPVVRETYAEASDVLGLDMAQLSFGKNADEIDLTRNTQPVLLTHSIACYRLFHSLTDGRVSPAMAAGHSLGEYSALVVADAISFEMGLRLVRRRGELMGQFGEGEMEALMINTESAVALAEAHYCSLAASNLPEQTVVGGRPEDLDALVTAMRNRFPRKPHTRLKTEGAFHTYYMVGAATRFRSVLEKAGIDPPTFPVLSNFTGGVHDNEPDSIRSRLFLQLFNPVLWYRNLMTTSEMRADTMIEFGGGLGSGETAADKRPNLGGLVKKAFRNREQPPTYFAVINIKTLEETVTALD